MTPVWRQRLLFVLQSAVVGLAAAFVLTYAWPGRVGVGTASGAAMSARASYSDAVKRATPSVVNIYTRRLVTEQPFRVFSDPVLQRFTGVPAGPQRSRLQRILGAGVIVREDGYVLTNFHVVQGSGDILAELADGRVTPAEVVGTDRDTDLAVLKIAGKGFTALPPAPENSLDVGDIVLAIGNPLGLGQTVTLGIVSATGRNQTSLSRYEDFIQTDAAINQGSSGGALVNSSGELVGINSALSGQGQGIGF
ncbi:MAG: trypsin-like peptidase domain-containing protein, partial [Lysobacterales bacterium]